MRFVDLFHGIGNGVRPILNAHIEHVVDDGEFAENSVRFVFFKTNVPQLGNVMRLDVIQFQLRQIRLFQLPEEIHLPCVPPFLRGHLCRVALNDLTEYRIVK